MNTPEYHVPECLIAEQVRSAASAIRSAEAVVIAAGAGMGVDSGLPDFRGPDGFWQAYPPYRKLGLSFPQLANPSWFAKDPHFAWGFYGHRLNLYRSTLPHPGFAMLRDWVRTRPHFVVTSNVDGQFQFAGFAPAAVLEVHGSIHLLQCLNQCGQAIWWAFGTEVNVNQDTFRASDPLPACPSCGQLARPNILMFGDDSWDETHTAYQHETYLRWWDEVAERRLVVLELGAGTAVPTIRLFSEQLVRRAGATLVRINVREADVPAGQISVPLPALAALTKVNDALARHKHASANDA